MFIPCFENSEDPDQLAFNDLGIHYFHQQDVCIAPVDWLEICG